MTAARPFLYGALGTSLVAKQVVHWLLKDILKEEVLLVAERWTVRCCLFLFSFAALRRVCCRPAYDRRSCYQSKQDLYYSQFLQEPPFEERNHPVPSRIRQYHST